MGREGKENNTPNITRTFLVSFNWAHSSYPQQRVPVCGRALVCLCFFICWVLTLKLLRCCIQREKPKWSEFMQPVHGITMQGALNTHTHTFIVSSFFDKLLRIKSICRLSFNAPLCGWINFWSFSKKPIPLVCAGWVVHSVTLFSWCIHTHTHTTYCMGIFWADRYRLPFRCTRCWCCFSCTSFST